MFHSSKLWLQAKQKLSEDDRELIHVWGAKDNHGIVNEVLASARDKQKEADAKKWKFQRKDGTVVVVKDVFDKMVDAIAKFQDAADFLVSLDASGHAALPWTGVKFFLSVSHICFNSSMV
jgi:hypothetical protein